MTVKSCHLEKDSGFETFTRNIVRLQTSSLTTMRCWIIKAKLPLEGESRVSVCACMFAKEQDGRLEHGAEILQRFQSFIDDAYHVEAEQPCWMAEILFAGSLHIRKSA